MTGGAGVLQGIEPVVLPPHTFPFHHHSFAGDELLGLNLGRQALGYPGLFTPALPTAGGGELGSGNSDLMQLWPGDRASLPYPIH